MKTITQIGLGVLLAVPIIGHAERVYLKGVGRDAVWNTSAGSSDWRDSNDASAVILADARGITSVTIQTYFRAYDAFGTMLPSPPTTFELSVEPVRDVYYPFFPVQNDLVTYSTYNGGDLYDCCNIPYEPATQVTVWMQDYSDGGVQPFLAAIQNLPGPETWQFGFSVLSYEAVPEPSSWMLIGAGLLCFTVAIWMGRK